MLHMHCGQWRLAVTTRPPNRCGPRGDQRQARPKQAVRLLPSSVAPQPRSEACPRSGRGAIRRRSTAASCFSDGQHDTAAPRVEAECSAGRARWDARSDAEMEMVSSDGVLGLDRDAMGLYIQRGVLVSSLDPVLLRRCRQPPGEAVRQRCRAASQGPPHRPNDAVGGKAPGE